MTGGKHKKNGQGQGHENKPPSCSANTQHSATLTTNQSGHNGTNENCLNTADIFGRSREILYGSNMQAPNTHAPILTNAHPDLQTFQSMMNAPGNTYQHFVNTHTMQSNGQANQQYGGQNVPTMQYNAQACNVPGPETIPPWALGLCQQMSSIQTILDGHSKRWQTAENNMASQNEKLTKMDKQLSEISNLKQALSNTNTEIYHVKDQLKKIQSQVAEYDNTIHQYSDMYDDMATNNSTTDRKLTDMETRLRKLEQKQQNMSDNIQDTNEKVTDVRWRSMRENLLFFGIPEEDGENCETKVKQFIANDMNIAKTIELDRAHRLGRYNHRHARPRPIVVKFTFFKDKELVRLSAPEVLSGTRFGVAEQFPPEIEQKRKELYQVAKMARENKNNKVKMVRDKLYINGQLYTEHNERNTDNVETRNENQTYTNGYRRGGNMIQTRRINTEQTARIFTRSTVNRNMSRVTENLQTQNRFSVLGDTTPDNRDNVRPTYGGKKKATSPLEDNATFKKQHYDANASQDDVMITSTQTADDTCMSSPLIPNNNINTRLHSQSPPSSSVITIPPSPIVTLPSGESNSGVSNGDRARASGGDMSGGEDSG